MFSVIDPALIEISEKILHTLEIHTSITKKKLIYICTTFLKIVSIISIVFLVYNNQDIILQRLAAFFNLIMYCVLTFILSNQQYKIIKKQKQESTLPKVIISRKDIRLIWLFSFPINIFFLYLLFLVEHDIYKNSVCIVFQLFLTIMVEYFLCARSLPPHEKEKKVQEKEMKYMTLQRM